MHEERPLVGEWRLIMHVVESGRVSVWLLHRPNPYSDLFNRLYSRTAITLTDQEILDSDWAGMVERAAQQAGAQGL